MLVARRLHPRLLRLTPASVHLARACRQPLSTAVPERPAKSKFLQRRSPQAEEPVAETPAPAEQKVRYGPTDVDLKPRDQLRPLLPTWNPPPTRPPVPDELEVSTRLRFRLEDRWWAATVREVGE